jgi:hypothetical protein
VFFSPELLALLVRERQRTVAREIASARRFRLRRALAAGVYAVAHVIAALGARLDDEPNAETAVETAAA